MTLIFSEHFGENRINSTANGCKIMIVKLCAFFLDHFVHVVNRNAEKLWQNFERQILMPRYSPPAKHHGIYFRGRMYICLSVSLYVCLYVYKTIIFESLDVGSLFLHIRYVCREYGSSLYMKVIGSRLMSQEQKGRKSRFPQCKTSIGNNSGSIKHRAIKFAYSIVFLDMADLMVRPPSLSRDQKW